MNDPTTPYKSKTCVSLTTLATLLAALAGFSTVVMAGEIDSSVNAKEIAAEPKLDANANANQQDSADTAISLELEKERKNQIEILKLDSPSPAKETLDQTPANTNQAPSIERDSFNSTFLGHNVTPTANLLKKGVATVGPYIIAFAPCQHVILASSPWIHFGYNMINLHMKTGFDLNKNEKVAFMASYFKTYNEERSASYIDNVGDRTDYTYLLYKQHSTTYSLLYSNKISSIYSIHTALSYLYYFDDTHPYSLHMESFKADKHEWIISALHETRLMTNFGINVETGLLGLNYRYPYLHYGVSFTYADRDWMIQLGMSHTMPTSGAHDRIDLENYRPTDAVHPEIQLQRFF